MMVFTKNKLGKIIFYKKVCVTFFSFYMILILNLSNSYALQKISNLIMYEKSEKLLDPFYFIKSNNVFSSYDLDKEQKENYIKLENFKSFTDDGEELKLSCLKDRKVIYASDWNKKQVLMSIIANLQKVGIEKSIDAIASISKKMNKTPDEFNTLTENLIQGYCSKNISVMSLKKIKFLLKDKFQSDQNLYPIVGKNKFLNYKYFSKFEKSRDYLEKSLYFSIELFKSFCSWGGDLENLRLLIPFLKNSTIMSHIHNIMNFENTTYLDNKIKKVKNFSIKPVLCKNFICRETSREQFIENIPKALGSLSFRKDIESLYCKYFKNVYYKSNKEDITIKEWIKNKTLDEDNVLVSNFISLLTDTLSFFNFGEYLNKTDNIFLSSINYFWDKWVQTSNEKLSDHIFYEEPLIITKVPDKFTKNDSSKINLSYDVNLGEFDDSFYLVNKLSLDFQLNLNKDYIRWVKRELNNTINDLKIKKKLKKNIALQIKSQVIERKKQFITAPWNENLELLLSNGILEKLLQAKIENLNYDEKSVPIQITLNYSPFALKYIHFKYLQSIYSKVVF